MLEKEYNSEVINLINNIQHGKLVSSIKIALTTEKMLERLISDGKWENAQELMQIIKNQIRKVAETIPQEVTTTNVMRHVLKVIRDEHEAGFKRKGEEQSLHHLVTANTNVSDYSESDANLKSSLVDHLCEYAAELETSSDNIATQALEHIHTSEIILTFGKSSTVEKFLKFAAKKRSFQVIVVEGAPTYQGHEMTASLAQSDIQTTLIPDSAVFAMMSRVNKVIIGTHSVMADGGLCGASGVRAIALAAKHYSVPVIVLAHMYKLTPSFASFHGQGLFNICASPAGVIPYSIGPLILNKVSVYNPLFEYVPPELVTLFISHQGGNAPSYIYRLLSELYHQDDYEIQ